MLFVAGVGSAVWIGWDLTAFALDGDRRSAPLTVLRLEQVQAGQDPGAYRDTFLTPAARVFEEYGGQIVARATTRLVVHGTVRDEWDFVTVRNLPTGSAFIDAVTTPEYRELDAAVAGRRSRLARYVVEQPWQSPMTRGLVVLLLRSGENSEAEGLQQLTSVASRYRGERVWMSKLSPLSDTEEPWETIVGYAFPTERLLADWLADPERMTNATLARSRLDRFALLVLDPV